MNLLKYKILLFTITLSLIYIAIFYLFSNSIELLSFNPEKVFAGEGWRLFTFPFAHLNQFHLFENVASLIIIGFILTELQMEFYDFAIIFLTASMLAPMPIFAISSFSALGASAAVYAGFGIITQNVYKFKIPAIIPIVLVIGIIFLKSVIEFFMCGVNCDSLLFALKQGGVHFAGFIFGIGMFHIMNSKSINIKTIFRGVKNGNQASG